MKVRACADCGVDIAHSFCNAKLCESCAYGRARQRERERHLEKMRKRRAGSPLRCAKCGVHIGGRRRRWCERCAEVEGREKPLRPASKAIRRQRYAAYGQQYRQRPEVKARRLEQRTRPEVKDRNRIARQAYRQRPEVKERRRELDRQRRQAPGQQARNRLNSSRRRARLKNALGVVSPDIEAVLMDLQAGRCNGPGCRRQLLKAGTHLDHVVPLARGGLHEDANLQLLCPPCNLNKHAKDPDEWAQQNGRLFAPPPPLLRPR